MAYRSSRLPTRFPVGTKFVIEGRPGGKGKVQVFSRYLEFPDGTLIRLPKRTAPAQQTPVDPKGPTVPRRRARRPGTRAH